jgi:hypothetical protein
MSGGRQIADENVEKFLAWVASKTDDDYRAMAIRGVLSRIEIATECGFAKSALAQNPRIKLALKQLEDDLRGRAVLPKAVVEASEAAAEPRMRQSEGLRSLRDAERLKRLEQENASLRAETAELKRLLGRFTVLQDALAQTGRIPR